MATKSKPQLTLEHLTTFIVEEKYVEAANAIQELKAAGNRAPELPFYEAICQYEDGEDLKCLHLLARFVKRSPKHPKRNYAVFTAAICLMNLGLDEEAFSLLKTLPKSYPDRDKEIRRLEKLFKNRAKALVQVNALQEVIKSTSL